MKDLREVGTKACIVGKIVKSRMKWAGHMVLMNYDKLPKRAETKKQEGSRKRGRPHLRWEDCVKRDLRKAEEEEKWREKANNRGQWKQITIIIIIMHYAPYIQVKILLGGADKHSVQNRVNIKISNYAQQLRTLLK